MPLLFIALRLTKLMVSVTLVTVIISSRLVTDGWAQLDLLTSACDNNGPLGMINGNIQDWQISVSSSYPQEWDKGCHERFARVYQPNGLAWCAKFKSSSEWLQIDLGVSGKITGVMTQGRADSSEWVTSFMISYSSDAYQWQYVKDQYGNQRVFDGNIDAYTVKHSYLDEPIIARFIKFHTIQWNKHPSMRVEVIGCQACKAQLALPPYSRMTASSEKGQNDGTACLAEDAFIISNKAWCAKHNDANQWLQIDVGPPTLITGVVTRGRGDTRRKQWVTRYRLSYSNDTRLWHFYKDASNIEPKEFSGNVDKDVERFHYLSTPFMARYIRFHPLEWKHHVSMRAGVLGCPHKGSCGTGFMKINADSHCVENVAYHKESWINNKRQFKRHVRTNWLHGQAGRAVDGNFDQALHSCTVLDNFYVDKPIWMVDLGVKRKIAGLIIYTWQGKDGEQQTNYRDYMYNLDRIVAYVDNKGGKQDINLPSNTCGFVTRLNDALFRPRIHLPCSKPLYGRYVYIEVWGVPNRWSKLFSAILCEVLVYE